VCVTVDVVSVYWAISAEASADSLFAAPKAGGDASPWGAWPSASGCLNDFTSVYLVSSLTGKVLAYTKSSQQQSYVTGDGVPKLYAAALASGPPEVFLTSPDFGTVYRCPLPYCGGSPPAIAAGQMAPYGVAADAENVYWTNRGDGSVMRASRTKAGEVSPIATGQGSPGGIRVDASSIYWVNQTGEIMRAPIDGGAPAMLTRAPSGAETVAVDDAHVYWVTAASGTVERIDKAGGVPLVLASGQSNPWDIAVDDAYVYWVNNSADGGVLRVAK
jgi:hypothetical protein